MTDSANHRWRWIRRTFFSVLLLVLIAAAVFYFCPVACYNEWTYLQEDFSGVESRTVRVTGYCVHYLVEGPANGSPVVLVHGLGASAEDWRALAPYLSHAGFRVYIPDLVGYGRSEKPRDFSYSVRDEANIVIGFMDALGLKQVELGGWSMGGWVAVIAAQEHPERVSRLMLFDAAGLNVTPSYDTALFVPTNIDQLRQLQAILSPQPRPIPAFIARDILRSFRHRGWVIQRALATMLTGRDVIDADLPQLKMPVLLAWGALDRVTPLAQGETMHRLIPHSELEVFSGCGHMAPIECSGAVGSVVAAFARENTSE